MFLGKCTATNFASYAHLEIDFSKPGLALLYGPTGSGKSTIPDLACWALFGCTAKGGTSDSVRSWQTPDTPTQVTQEVRLSKEILTITRIRGKANQNDLYFQVNQGEPLRGKDLKDTQKLLNERLGLDADVYLNSAYFSEFSPASKFFLASAKDRRNILEQVANLSLPITLAERTATAKKAVKAEIAQASSVLSKNQGKVQKLEEFLIDLTNSQFSWDCLQANKLTTLRKALEGYEQGQIEIAKKITSNIKDLALRVRPESDYTDALGTVANKLKSLPPSKCTECGAPRAGKEKEQLTQQRYRIEKEQAANAQLLRDLNRERGQLIEAKKAENHYQAQYDRESATPNPFLEQVLLTRAELSECAQELAAAKALSESLESRLSDLSQLYDLSLALRGELLEKAVMELEEDTNRYLEKFFDAEIRVTFTLEQDSLEVSIQKSGYDCQYSQLSKGQRGLLKLCFVVSIMHASSNKAGIAFGNLYLDEALDGLDSDLKVKAYSLLEELSTQHASIWVIDHSPELQTLFTQKYRVELVGDSSEIEELEA